MASCPNCGQATARTLDLACPFCGYPLLSGSFRTMSKTLREIRRPKVPAPETPPQAAAAAPAPVDQVVTVAEAETAIGAESAAGSPDEAAAHADETPPLPEDAAASGGDAASEAEIEASLAEPEVVESEIEHPGTEPEPEAEVEIAAVAELADDAVAEGPSPATGGEAGTDSDLAPTLEAEPPGMLRYLRRHPPRAAAEAEEELPPGVLRLTVEELHAACREDAQGSSGRLAGSTLRITGTVGKIVDTEAVENPCVILTSPDNRLVRNVLCVFDRKDADVVNRLAAGRQVTVQGAFDSCTISVLVTDCTLIDDGT